MKRIRTRAALLLTLCLVLSAVWFMGVSRAYGDWRGVLTPAPAEIWADAGETVTVSFVGSIVGEEPPATMMGRDDQGRERVFTRVGPEWVPVNDSNGSTTSAGNALSKRVTVPSYYAGGTLSVTMQVRVAYWWELAGLDPRIYSRPYDYQYVEATCLIHVRSAPAPQPTPTPTLPYPPYPTPTSPNPTPTSPTPAPTPTYPRPTPTSPNPTPTYPTPSPSPTPTYPNPPTTFSQWSPLDKEIGYDRQNETWVPDGRMIAPVDQRGGARPTPTSPTPTPTSPTPTPISPTPAPTPTYRFDYSRQDDGAGASGAVVRPRNTLLDTLSYYGTPYPTSPTPYPTSPTPTPYPYPTSPTPSPTSPTPTPTPTSQPADKTVAAGARVPCEVEEAHDWDTLTQSNYSYRTTSRTYHVDGPLTYQWSADKGRFEGATNARTATWIAPDDITEATTAIVQCTINDPDGPRVQAPETGSHDDDALVRSATIKVERAFVYLTGSAPDFIVYRNPADPTPTPEPVESETVSTGTAADTTGGSVGVDSFDEADHSADQDADAPPENPDDWIPQDQEFINDAPPEAAEPVISFGIHSSGFGQWKATVSVYAMSEDNGTLAAPLATTELTGRCTPQDADKMRVKWSQLFPDINPASGLYFYDVKVEGAGEAGSSAAGDGFFGVQDDRDSHETQRLDTNAVISDVVWQVLEDEPQQPPFATLTTAGGAASDDELWPNVEVTFRLSGAGPTSTLPKLWLIDPELEREQALSVERLADGRYKATWKAKAETLKQMGRYLLTADASGKTPVKKAVPAFKSADNGVTVDGFALGYEMMQPDGSTPANSATLRRYPNTGYYAKFRAFVKVTQKIKGANGTHWYSDVPVANGTLDRFEWISENVAGRIPRDVKKSAKDWSGNPRSLGLRVTWRQFHNEIVKQESAKRYDSGNRRWYGLRAQKVASGWVLNRQVDLGVTWWGARVDYNKKGQPRVWQLPTDRQGGTLDFPLAQERSSRHYAQPNFDQIDPYYNEKQRRLWMPDPSGRDKGKWNGRIVGQGWISAPTFDSADTSANFGQGALNAVIMHYATGFINTPYGWGGQTYGGQQSRSVTEMTSTVLISKTDYEALDIPGNLLGDSQLKSSYGIDCSGFVSEAAYLAGITGLGREGDTASGLMGDGVSVSDFKYLRPGDFVAWRKHTFYVAQAPVVTPGQVAPGSTVLPSLEAQPDSLGNELGRTRYSSIRNKGDLINSGAVWRRWSSQ